MFQKLYVETLKRYWDQDCVVCGIEEKGLCNKENAGYSITCHTCWENKKELPMKERNDVMHGETSRTARIRCGEHKAALVKRENSNLWEHGGK